MLGMVQRAAIGDALVIEQRAEGEQAVELVCEGRDEETMVGSEAHVSAFADWRIIRPFVRCFGLLYAVANALLNRRGNQGATARDREVLRDVVLYPRCSQVSKLFSAENDLRDVLYVANGGARF